MSRKNRIKLDPDGTPVETNEIDPEEAGPDVPLVHEVPVYWTKKGEEQGAFSEHGAHKAGDKVMTAYAPLLIERGFASDTPPDEEGA